MRNLMKEKYVYGKSVGLTTVPSPIHFKIAWTEYLMHRSEQKPLQHPVTDYLHPLKPAD